MFTTLRSPARRGAAFAIASCAGAGGSLIVLVCIPQLLRLGSAAAVLLAVLAVAELAAVVVAAFRPRRLWLTGAAASGIVLLWLVTGVGGIGADPWAAVNNTVGLTSRIVIALQLVTVATAFIRPRVSRPRAMVWVVAVPVLVVTVLASAGGLVAASNGFQGSSTRNSVEYCRPNGVPLSMDLYRPAGHALAPVVLYVHGGGFLLGNRTLRGPWASAQEEALFTPVRDRLTSRGIAVASIDYRLLPGSDWRAPIEDAKCAVRFLRANATRLGIDGGHIGAWGSSAGGTLVSLLGLSPGFETSEYADQPSTVQAVVDMFGPSDLTNLGDSSGFVRTVSRLALGTKQDRLRALSPIRYVTKSAPPFLILHGEQDSDMPIRHSRELVARLQQAGVSVRFIPVQGTGHALSTPTEQPSPEVLANDVADFLTQKLR